MLSPRSALEVHAVTEPPPEREPPGKRRDELFALLTAMEVGGTPFEVNIGRKSLVNYVYRYRRLYGREMRFRVRPRRPGWAMVWRVPDASEPSAPPLA